MILVTFITTNLVTLVAIIVWRTHPAIALAVWLPFVTLDALYSTSALTKVPSGAWFTILLAVILASFFTLWRYGKEKQWSCESSGRLKLPQLFSRDATDDSRFMLAERLGGGTLAEIDGMGIFFDKTGEMAPAVFEQWLRKLRAEMKIVVLMHMRALSVPHVLEEDRFAVAQTIIPDVYRLVIRHGYNDHVVTPDLAAVVYAEVRKAILRDAARPNGMATSSAIQSSDEDEMTGPRLRRLETAYENQVLYAVGKEQMRISSEYNIFKQMVLGTFLWVRENCRGRIAKMNVPTDKLVEIGFVIEI